MVFGGTPAANRDGVSRNLKQNNLTPILMSLNLSDLIRAFPDLGRQPVIDASTAKRQLGTSREGAMGMPILMPIGFSVVQWAVRINGEISQDSFPGLELPGAVVASYERAKNIVKTRIAGRNGTVKEFTGWDDWAIVIRGIWVSDTPGELPEQGIRDLRDLSEVPVSIVMQCAMNEWLGIHEVDIESIEFPDAEGIDNAQPFIIRCSSSEPFEFSIR